MFPPVPPRVGSRPPPPSDLEPSPTAIPEVTSTQGLPPSEGISPAASEVLSHLEGSQAPTAPTEGAISGPRARLQSGISELERLSATQPESVPALLTQLSQAAAEIREQPRTTPRDLAEDFSLLRNFYQHALQYQRNHAPTRSLLDSTAYDAHEALTAQFEASLHGLDAATRTLRDFLRSSVQFQPGHEISDAQLDNARLVARLSEDIGDIRGMATDLGQWANLLTARGSSFSQPADSYGEILQAWARMDAWVSGAVEMPEGHYEPNMPFTEEDILHRMQGVESRFLAALPPELQSEANHATVETFVHESIETMNGEALDRMNFAALTQFAEQAAGLEANLSQISNIEEVPARRGALIEALHSAVELGSGAHVRRILSQIEATLQAETPDTERLQVLTALNATLDGSNLGPEFRLRGAGSDLAFRMLRDSSGTPGEQAARSILARQFLETVHDAPGIRFSETRLGEIRDAIRSQIQSGEPPVTGQARVELAGNLVQLDQLLLNSDLEAAQAAGNPQGLADRVITGLVDTVTFGQVELGHETREHIRETERDIVRLHLETDLNVWHTALMETEGLSPDVELEQSRTMLTTGMALRGLASGDHPVLHSEFLEPWIGSVERTLGHALDHAVVLGPEAGTDERAMRDLVLLDLRAHVHESLGTPENPGDPGWIAALNTQSLQIFAEQSQAAHNLLLHPETPLAETHALLAQSGIDLPPELESRFAAAQIFSQMGLRSQVVETLRPVREHISSLEGEEHVAERANLLLLISQSYQQAGMTEEANGALGEVAALDSEGASPELHQIATLARGMSELNQGHREAALEIFNTIPENPMAQGLIENLRLGSQAQRYSQAVACLRALSHNFLERGREAGHDMTSRERATDRGWREVERLLTSGACDSLGAAIQRVCNDPRFGEFTIGAAEYHLGGAFEDFVQAVDHPSTDAEFNEAMFEFASAMRRDDYALGASEIYQHLAQSQDSEIRERAQAGLSSIPTEARIHGIMNSFAVFTSGTDPVTSVQNLAMLLVPFGVARGVAVGAESAFTATRLGLYLAETAPTLARTAGFAIRTTTEAATFTLTSMSLTTIFSAGRINPWSNFGNEFGSMLVTFVLCHGIGMGMQRLESLATRSEALTTVSQSGTRVLRPWAARGLGILGYSATILGLERVEHLNADLGFRPEEEGVPFWTRLMGAVAMDAQMRASGHAVEFATGGTVSRAEEAIQQRYAAGEERWLTRQLSPTVQRLGLDPQSPAGRLVLLHLMSRVASGASLASVDASVSRTTEADISRTLSMILEVRPESAQASRLRALLYLYHAEHPDRPMAETVGAMEVEIRRLTRGLGLGEGPASHTLRSALLERFLASGMTAEQTRTMVEHVGEFRPQVEGIVETLLGARAAQGILGQRLIADLFLRSLENPEGIAVSQGSLEAIQTQVNSLGENLDQGQRQRLAANLLRFSLDVASDPAATRSRLSQFSHRVDQFMALADLPEHARPSIFQWAAEQSPQALIGRMARMVLGQEGIRVHDGRVEAIVFDSSAAIAAQRATVAERMARMAPPPPGAYSEREIHGMMRTLLEINPNSAEGRRLLPLLQSYLRCFPGADFAERVGQLSAEINVYLHSLGETRSPGLRLALLERSLGQGLDAETFASLRGRLESYASSLEAQIPDLLRLGSNVPEALIQDPEMGRNLVQALFENALSAEGRFPSGEALLSRILRGELSITRDRSGALHLREIPQERRQAEQESALRRLVQRVSTFGRERAADFGVSNQLHVLETTAFRDLTQRLSGSGAIEENFSAIRTLLNQVRGVLSETTPMSHREDLFRRIFSGEITTLEQAQHRLGFMELVQHEGEGGSAVEPEAPEESGVRTRPTAPRETPEGIPAIPPPPPEGPPPRELEIPRDAPAPDVEGITAAHVASVEGQEASLDFLRNLAADLRNFTTSDRDLQRQLAEVAPLIEEDIQLSLRGVGTRGHAARERIDEVIRIALDMQNAPEAVAREMIVRDILRVYRERRAVAVGDTPEGRDSDIATGRVRAPIPGRRGSEERSEVEVPQMAARTGEETPPRASAEELASLPSSLSSAIELSRGSSPLAPAMQRILRQMVGLREASEEFRSLQSEANLLLEISNACDLIDAEAGRPSEAPTRAFRVLAQNTREGLSRETQGSSGYREILENYRAERDRIASEMLAGYAVPMDAVLRFLRGLPEDDATWAQVEERYPEMDRPELAEGMEPSGRLKAPADILSKLARRGWHSLEPFTDLAGTRVVVEGYEDVTSLIAMLQTRFQIREVRGRDGEIVRGRDGEPVPDRDTFRRLIEGVPSRGYRAIHVTVEVDGRPVEVQIQTRAIYEWGQIQHSLTYKNSELPESLRLDIQNYCRDAAQFLADVEQGASYGEPPSHDAILDSFGPDLPLETRVSLETELRRMNALLHETARRAETETPESVEVEAEPMAQVISFPRRRPISEVEITADAAHEAAEVPESRTVAAEPAEPDLNLETRERRAQWARSIIEYHEFHEAQADGTYSRDQDTPEVASARAYLSALENGEAEPSDLSFLEALSDTAYPAGRTGEGAEAFGQCLLLRPEESAPAGREIWTVESVTGSRLLARGPQGQVREFSGFSDRTNPFVAGDRFAFIPAMGGASPRSEGGSTPSGGRRLMQRIRDFFRRSAPEGSEAVPDSAPPSQVGAPARLPTVSLENYEGAGYRVASLGSRASRSGARPRVEGSLATLRESSIHASDGQVLLVFEIGFPAPRAGEAPQRVRFFVDPLQAEAMGLSLRDGQWQAPRGSEFSLSMTYPSPERRMTAVESESGEHLWLRRSNGSFEGQAAQLDPTRAGEERPHGSRTLSLDEQGQIILPIRIEVGPEQYVTETVHIDPSRARQLGIRFEADGTPVLIRAGELFDLAPRQRSSVPAESPERIPDSSAARARRTEEVADALLGPLDPATANPQAIELRRQFTMRLTAQYMQARARGLDSDAAHQLWVEEADSLAALGDAFREAQSESLVGRTAEGLREMLRSASPGSAQFTANLELWVQNRERIYRETVEEIYLPREILADELIDDLHRLLPQNVMASSSPPRDPATLVEALRRGEIPSEPQRRVVIRVLEGDTVSAQATEAILRSMNARLETRGSAASNWVLEFNGQEFPILVQVQGSPSDAQIPVRGPSLRPPQVPDQMPVAADIGSPEEVGMDFDIEVTEPESDSSPPPPGGQGAFGIAVGGGMFSGADAILDSMSQAAHHVSPTLGHMVDMVPHGVLPVVFTGLAFALGAVWMGRSGARFEAPPASRDASPPPPPGLPFRRLPNGEEILVIGRGAASRPVDFAIPDRTISREHATIRRQADGSMTLEGRGGDNGTWMWNGRVWFEVTSPQALQPGHWIAFGRPSGIHEVETADGRVMRYADSHGDAFVYSLSADGRSLDRRSEGEAIDRADLPLHAPLPGAVPSPVPVVVQRTVPVGGGVEPYPANPWSGVDLQGLPVGQWVGIRFLPNGSAELATQPVAGREHFVLRDAEGRLHLRAGTSGGARVYMLDESLSVEDENGVLRHPTSLLEPGQEIVFGADSIARQFAVGVGSPEHELMRYVDLPALRETTDRRTIPQTEASSEVDFEAAAHDSEPLSGMVILVGTRGYSPYEVRTRVSDRETVYEFHLSDLEAPPGMPRMLRLQLPPGEAINPDVFNPLLPAFPTPSLEWGGHRVEVVWDAPVSSDPTVDPRIAQLLQGDLGGLTPSRAESSLADRIPNLPDDVREALRRHEAAFDAGSQVMQDPFQTGSGRFLMMNFPSGAMTFESRAATEADFRAYQVWEAHRHVPRLGLDSATALRDLSSFAYQHGIAIHQGMMGSGNGEQMQYLLGVLRMLPESFLESGYLRGIHIGAGRVGMRGAAMGSAFEDGEVHLYSGVLRGSRLNMLALFLHELGHSTDHRYDVQDGDSSIPLFVREEIARDFQIVSGSRDGSTPSTVFGLDWGNGRQARIAYTSETLGEFLAEFNLHYVAAGPLLREHIQNIPNPAQRAAYQRIYEEMRDRVYGAREY